MAGAGGPRSVGVRSWPVRAAFRLAPAEHMLMRGMSALAGETARAKAGVVDAASVAGNCGQRDGALNAAPEPSLCAADASASMAQW